MIKAVFFDLDGTLLDSRKKVPASAKAAIRAALEKGVKVFFASGRSPRLEETVGWTEDEFSLFDGGIYSNGACVDFDGEIRYTFIDPEVVRSVIREVRRFPEVHMSLHMPRDGYAFNFPVEESMTGPWGLAKARVTAMDEDAVGSTLKILIFYDHLTDSVRALPEELVARVRSVSEGAANAYLTDAGRTVQMSGKGAGKLPAIEEIRQRLGFAPEEVSVFGDDVNDLEMISFYKNSVAMGNAAPEVAQAAGFVTAANDDDGVKQGLELLMQIK